MSKVSDYRHRITLQKQVDIVDDEGFPSTDGDWSDWAIVWAAVEPLSTNRLTTFFAAAAVNAENTIIVRIRYRPGVTADMRVKYGNRIFDIDHLIDVDERHRELQLVCREVVNGG
jgi:SPP1 family predicted phage head-tail adaptor